jgi:PKD repeat protein
VLNVHRFLSRAAPLLWFAPVLALAQSSPIDCNTTPFGKGDRMVQDDEFLSLFSNGDNSSNGFGEYRLPFAGETDPLVSVYDDALPEIPLDATNVDLKGDGRDMVAVAYQSSTTLVVGVYERTAGFAPGYHLLRNWKWNAGPVDFSQVHLIAGDFSGSAGRQQELAVLWSGGASDGRFHLVILTGAADGGIANADNSSSGEWFSPGNFFAPTVGLARGDFLLDGRDQIAVVSANTPNLYYDLLEYNDKSSIVPVNSGLPIAAGDTGIGSKQFTSTVIASADDAFDSASVGYVYCDAAPCSESISPFGQPDKIVASAGDIVDSAAAELVVHVSDLVTEELRDTNGALQTGAIFSGRILAQRLLHFATAQAMPGGDISDVALAGSGAGRDFDFNQNIGTRDSGFSYLTVPEATVSDFDVAIGAVDGQEKQSVALARVVSGGQLHVDVYQASVRLSAGFQFTVHGATGPFPVDFANNSTGDVADVSWDFGDGSTSVATNPSHSYNATGTYTVKLTATDSAGKTSSYQSSVQINGQAGNGGVTANYTYQMTTTPVFSAATQDQYLIPSPGENESILNNFATGSAPRIAIGDMNRDGFAEIMTTAQSVVSDQITSFPPSITDRATIWRSLWRVDPTLGTFSGTHAQQVMASATSNTGFPPPNPPPLPYTAAATLASDFDGDSTYATLGSDCRQVSEPQLRDLVWMPPFFAALQSGSLANGEMSASFGINQKSGSGTENRSGSFTGNDVSGYLGVKAGDGDKFPVKFEISVVATAGHDWQSAHGAIHGSDTEYDYSEGQEATEGEALVVAEADDANCYSYDVVQSTGAVPDSSMRMCQITYQERTAETGETWNAQVDYTQTSPNWVPVQRDWASLAMFLPATSTIPFSSGEGPENVTDGLFSTSAVSVTTTEPYLDIDLGKVQSIASIRVFPAANTDASGKLVTPLAFNRAAAHLQGFRIYTSATPFTGADVPSRAGVIVFAPGTPNDVVYDRWNIMTLDSNFRPLAARYIRLQHPGQDPATIDISQIEVFGDTHADPPAYPDAVCEPTANNGYFLARVWNAVAAGYQNIEERGDLTWSGTNATRQPTGVTLANGQACLNQTDVRETTIWNNLRIGNTGITNSWDSTSDTTNTVGSYGSIESATRVGAEMETAIGSEFVQAVAGASYEYTFGVTSDTQSTSFWGNGLEIGGTVGGFDPQFENMVLPCGYFPHPYSYHLTERGNTSYQHDLYVVDYTVHQPNTSSAWQRGSVPLACTGQDEIFADVFGN